MVQCLVAKGCPGDLHELKTIGEILVNNGICNERGFAMVNYDDIHGLEACSAAAGSFLRSIISIATTNFGHDESAVLAKKGIFESVGSSVSAKVVLQVMQQMHLKQSSAVSVGPMNKINEIANAIGNEKRGREWADNARIEALCSSCGRSMGTVISAVRCWQEFCSKVLGIAAGKELPPTADGLAAWSRCFRNKGTYMNYLNGLKLACLIGGVPSDALEHPAVARAKRGLLALQAAPKPKRYIRQTLLVRLVKMAIEAGDRKEALAYVLSYAFLLRVPSECLPIIVGQPESGSWPLTAGSHSRLSLTNDKLVLQLARRKNKQHGSTLMRSCWCQSCKVTCPVHNALIFLKDKMWHGQNIFAGITPAGFVRTLRARLARLDIKDPDNYGSHDFRRGHAVDMQLGGRSLGEILRAGEWSSPAFMKYLDMVESEAGACLEAHLDESEEDIGDPGLRKRGRVI